ncbi:hypothetical protein K438DRAFT_1998917 [Mycena galopus ATCC 62051]|nr:hypothetical protein K438DRAFT_1998917 [Mycena galopus ATCC 62051]
MTGSRDVHSGTDHSFRCNNSQLYSNSTSLYQAPLELTAAPMINELLQAARDHDTFRLSFPQLAMADTIPLDDTTLAHDTAYGARCFLRDLGKHIWGRNNQAQLGLVLTVRYVAYSAILLRPRNSLGISAPRRESLVNRFMNFIERSCSCKKLSVAENSLLAFQEILIEAVTLAVRVCEMYGLNRRVFAALAVAAAITVSLSAAYGDTVTVGSLAWVTSAISARMLSRLMPNLHTAVDRDWTTSTYTGAQETEMRQVSAT